MASLEHQALIELLRERPESIAAVLREFAGVAVPEGGRVAIADSQLGDVAPVQRCADLVAELHGPDGRRQWAVVVEVQRAIDPRKLLQWPAYLAAARARSSCPTTLLVLARDPQVAAWAARPIVLGRPCDAITPVVLGPATVPRVTDLAVARARPVVAALSALIHNRSRDDLEVISCACRAVRSLDADAGEVYAQLILQGLGQPLRRELLGEDTLMERTQATPSTGAQPAEKPVSPELAWVRRLWKRMDEEEARAIAQGRLLEKREILGKLAARAGVPLSPELQARVESCEDPAAFDRWIDRALAGVTGAALFD